MPRGSYFDAAENSSFSQKGLRTFFASRESGGTLPAGGLHEICQD
jgi:hypothetical protein